MADDDLTPYGFTWGPMEVQRAARVRHKGRETYILRVLTEHGEVQVSVSAKGRSLRADVIKGGRRA